MPISFTVTLAAFTGIVRFLTVSLRFTGTKRVYTWVFPPFRIVMRSPTMPALPFTRTSSLAFLWNGVTTFANRILCRTFFLACLDLMVVTADFVGLAITGPVAVIATAWLSWVGV